MTAIPAVALLVVAAGRGSRFGHELPKQYHDLGDKPVLAHVLAAGQMPLIDRVLTVIHPDHWAFHAEALAASGLAPERASYCAGGTSRQESVRLGLEELAQTGFPDHGIVLVHDAARPFLSAAMIASAIAGAARHGAVIPVLALADTLALVDAEGRLAGNADRNQLRSVQTPQAFRFAAIRAAHARAASDARGDFTDDASLLRAFGHEVRTIPGDPDLFKITLAADLARAEAKLAAGSGSVREEFRAGIGYDVHAFAAGDHLMLGGVRIAHDKALSGHSDADPVLHALTDALLGVIGDGDIGAHFPPSDPQWRGAASRIFLEDAARRVAARRGRVVSVDCTIICEAPKVGPHRHAMQAMIGAILGLSLDRVGVKATTSEGLGFTGRREGIAAMAVASVAFPLRA